MNSHVFQDPNSFATTIFVATADLFHNPDPKKPPRFLPGCQGTLRQELSETCGVNVLPVVIDRLMAAITLVTTDRFYRNLPDFIDLALVLSGEPFDPTTQQPLDACSAAWAMTEGIIIYPPEDPEHAFSDEIRHYLGGICQYEGIIEPADILAIAILEPQYIRRVDEIRRESPGRAQALDGVRTAHEEQIKETLHDCMHKMLQQLKGLKLVHGDTTGIAGRAAAEL